MKTLENFVRDTLKKKIEFFEHITLGAVILAKSRIIERTFT